MANPTLFQIATQTLGSSTASVTFSNIPQVYTDLKLVMSTRTSSTNAQGWFDTILTINGTATTGSSTVLLYGSGSGSGSSITESQFTIRTADANNTANTFGSAEVYIPNYTSSAYKSLSCESVSENNATAAIQELHAFLWSNTAAVTSLVITGASSTNLLQYSTFTLYGIRNY
jgi:hypothetical protein